MRARHWALGGLAFLVLALVVLLTFVSGNGGDSDGPPALRAPAPRKPREFRPQAELLHAAGSDPLPGVGVAADLSQGAAPAPGVRPARQSALLRGLVVDDESDEPVERFRLHSLPTSSTEAIRSYARLHPGRSRVVRQGPAGFEFPGLEAGSYTLLVEAPGYESVEVPAVVVPGGEVASPESSQGKLEVRLGRGPNVRGLLLDAFRTPVAGAEVQLTRVEAFDDQRFRAARTHTDEDGSYRFTLLPPGRYRLTWGAGPLATGAACSIGAGETVTLDLAWLGDPAEAGPLAR